MNFPIPRVFRFGLGVALFTILAFTITALSLQAHVIQGEHAHHKHSVALKPQDNDDGSQTESTNGAVTGQGDMRFRVLHTRSLLPEKAQSVLQNAHGGFAVDRRGGHGDVYFALPGAGIIHIDPSLQNATLLDTPPDVRDTNLHNTTIWYDNQETPRLVFPANQDGKVFTTSLEGELLNVLNSPDADFDFDQPNVNTYFDDGGSFVPTDVEFLNQLYYITTGYSDLDYVLTAQVQSSPLSVSWHDLAFGGKGEAAGQFQTGHGITVAPNGKHLDVADRPVAELDRFTRYGHYRETTNLPEGAYVCDVDYRDEYAVVPCLHGPDRDKGAPVYIMKDNEVISTIMPKEDLGLERFQHIHNAVMVNRGGRYYLIIQAWNPGDFVILEQTK